MLTGQRQRGVCTIHPHDLDPSRRWIHGSYCLPDPIGRREELVRAHQLDQRATARSSTRPVRTHTTRVPGRSAFFASSSQSIHNCCEKIGARTVGFGERAKIGSA